MNNKPWILRNDGGVQLVFPIPPWTPAYVQWLYNHVHKVVLKDLDARYLNHECDQSDPAFHVDSKLYRCPICHKKEELTDAILGK